jgi:hypothetical protein
MLINNSLNVRKSANMFTEREYNFFKRIISSVEVVNALLLLFDIL